MKLNYKFIIGLICIVIGVVFIIYAEHALHQTHVMMQSKTFFQKMQDFFVHLGKTITGSPEKKAIASPLNMKIYLGIGSAFIVIGALLVVFCRKKRI